MLEVLHNICNMGSRDLPDMSALALRRCAPSGSCVHIMQITPAHVTYITCILAKPVMWWLLEVLIAITFPVDFYY